MHSSELRSASFSAGRLSLLDLIKGQELYDKHSVDNFLWRWADELESYERGQAGTGREAEEILTHRFALTRFAAGYDPDEIDEFLDQLVKQVREYAAAPPRIGRTRGTRALESSDIRRRSLSMRGINALDRGEVDAFIALAADAVASHESGRPALLTATHVRTLRFTPALIDLGYDADEVAQFVDEVIATLRVYEVRRPHRRA